MLSGEVPSYNGPACYQPVQDTLRDVYFLREYKFVINDITVEGFFRIVLGVYGCQRGNSGNKASTMFDIEDQSVCPYYSPNFYPDVRVDLWMGVVRRNSRSSSK